MNDADYLHLLGLNKNSSKDDLKARYKQLCQILHPDSGGDNDLFILVKEAYESLKNYDSFKNVAADNFNSNSHNESSAATASASSANKKKSKRSKDSYTFNEIVRGVDSIEFSCEEIGRVRDCIKVHKSVPYDGDIFTLIFDEETFLSERHRNLFLVEPITIALYCKPSIFSNMMLLEAKEAPTRTRILERTEIVLSYVISFPKRKSGKIEVSFCGEKRQVRISPSAKTCVINFSIYDYNRSKKLNEKHGFPFTSLLELSASIKFVIERTG